MHRKYMQFHLQSLKIKFTGTTSPVCLHFHAMTELNSCNQENRTVNPTVFAFWPSQKSLCPLPWKPVYPSLYTHLLSNPMVLKGGNLVLLLLCIQHVAQASHTVCFQIYMSND